jgi:hypothetical protein
MMNIISFYQLNYKTCLLYFICSFILCDYNFLLAIICFLYGYFVCYLGHRFMHIDLLYFNIHSISHNFHHIHSGIFANILNYIIEYLTIIDNIVIKYIYKQFGYNLIFINEWVILFLYFIYTTVHNINYSIFKVNDYHSKHHEDVYTNIGPDIFDYLCYSKNKDTCNHEYMDHYIPNIIGAFIIVWILKYMYSNLTNKDIFPGIFTFLFFVLHAISIFACIYICYMQIDNIIKQDLDNFYSLLENNSNNISKNIAKEKIEFKF